ncbi:Hypothetical predicted protein, partial [Podarcis lilfordi]
MFAWCLPSDPEPFELAVAEEVSPKIGLDACRFLLFNSSSMLLDSGSTLLYMAQGCLEEDEKEKNGLL